MIHPSPTAFTRISEMADHLIAMAKPSVLEFVQERTLIKHARVTHLHKIDSQSISSSAFAESLVETAPSANVRDCTFRPCEVAFPIQPADGSVMKRHAAHEIKSTRSGNCRAWCL